MSFGLMMSIHGLYLYHFVYFAIKSVASDSMRIALSKLALGALTDALVDCLDGVHRVEFF